MVTNDLPASEWTETVATLFGGQQPTFNGGSTEMRQQYADFAAAMASLTPTDLDDKVDVSEETFCASDGVDIRILIFIPTTIPTRKLGVHYHGGGWVIGTPEGETYLCKALAIGMSSVIVSPDYRLAPEWVYPTPMNDSYDTLLWAHENASKWGASQETVFVSGNSAGSNLATAVSVRNREEGGKVPVRASLLLVPCLMRPGDTPDHLAGDLKSYQEKKNAPILSLSTMDTFWNLYQPDTHPYASPLLLESFKGLPPAYIVVCGLDLLRDDGVLFSKLLARDGVRSKVEECAGFPHSFFLIPNLASSKRLLVSMVAGLKWALSEDEGSPSH